MIKGGIKIEGSIIEKNFSQTDKISTIFLIDDHPLVVSGFAYMIDSIQTSGYKNHFIKAYNCKEALHLLTTQKKADKKIDIAIVDIGLPPYKDLKSGGDIIILIKDFFPECKIIILTAFVEPMLVYNLLQKEDIEAVLCKSDVDHEQFVSIYKNVLSGEQIRSKTIASAIKEIAQRTLHFDPYDLEILQKMAQGIKTKDLPLHIPLGISAIEKRKTNLKIKLFAKDSKGLITSGKKAGLL